MMKRHSLCGCRLYSATKAKLGRTNSVTDRLNAGCEAASGIQRIYVMGLNKSRGRAEVT